MYTECIIGDQKVLGSFYRSSALLQDSELTSVILRLFGSLSHVRFALPLNVASFNFWQPGPLALCGLWEPPEDSENVSPVIRGVDVDDYFIKDDKKLSKLRKERLPLAKDKDREKIFFSFVKNPVGLEFWVPFEAYQRKTVIDSLGLPTSIADEIEQALKLSIT
ncbi:pleckstrin homology domain-containing family M member 1-like [Tropilaelaps mercedesae]|uniref:Pleckstrin homology domain-containing family M member 1-like n=1 Tax=Tropilaelaps mercedesae TaxID=418985 RepID=A0A1V9XTB7_9ACAR|nr:pleckstrin homology domain-containing family M member 1-like [Tropilaelaps mercedesae]